MSMSMVYHSGKKVPGGVRLQLQVAETECGKQEAECGDLVRRGPGAGAGLVRSCEVTVARQRNILNIPEQRCVAGGE